MRLRGRFGLRWGGGPGSVAGRSRGGAGGAAPLSSFAGARSSAIASSPSRFGSSRGRLR